MAKWLIANGDGTNSPYGYESDIGSASNLPNPQKSVTENIGTLYLDNSGNLRIFGVFSTQPWWGSYMFGFLYPYANKYNFSVAEATLFKSNAETSVSTSKFSIGTENGTVRIGCSDSTVAGCMVAMKLTVTKK